MAKNKIQFQKGLSLPRFLSQYGTEKQCRKALFKMRWPQGYRCPKCGHTGYCEICDRKVYQCHKCHFQASLIQGTIFAATKLPFTAWLLGIYLVTQSKDGISSLHLARTVGISANAALRMKHKLQQVMKDRDEFYRGRNHAPLCNAAQPQRVDTGPIHGYLQYVLDPENFRIDGLAAPTPRSVPGRRDSAPSCRRLEVGEQHNITRCTNARHRSIQQGNRGIHPHLGK